MNSHHTKRVSKVSEVQFWILCCFPAVLSALFVSPQCNAHLSLYCTVRNRKPHIQHVKQLTLFICLSKPQLTSHIQYVVYMFTFSLCHTGTYNAHLCFTFLAHFNAFINKGWVHNFSSVCLKTTVRCPYQGPAQTIKYSKKYPTV